METYFFPINAVLNDSTNGFIEFRSEDDVFLTSIPAGRKIKASRNSTKLPMKFSKVLDLKALRIKIVSDEDVKYLVLKVNQNNQHITLGLD